MKYFFLCLLCFVFNKVAFAQPVINSFLPIAAIPLEQVQISGSGFSTAPDSNIVYFGTVRGTVVSALENQLSVTVPIGAAYAPISVATGGLIGYSYRFFTPLTNNAINKLEVGSFRPILTMSAPQNYGAGLVRVCDIDGDGKLDIAASDTSYNPLVGLYRNTTTPGISTSISFDNTAAVNTYSPGNTPFLLADFNGDGKQDLASYGYGGTLKCYKNISIPAGISFTDSTGANFTNPFDDGFASDDLDKDGKVDIVICSYHKISNYFYDSVKISVLNNSTASNGAIGFNIVPDVLIHASTVGVNSISLADFDGDGKSDLIFNIQDAGVGKFCIARNTCTPGNFSFAAPVYISPIGYNVQIKIGDIDNDGLLDFVMSSIHSSGAAIYRNTSTIGNISFAPGGDLYNSVGITEATISDFDGDGKVDIACIGNNWYTGVQIVTVYKSHSAPGAIAFDNGVDIGLFGNPRSITAGDMDGDGKTDIVVGFKGRLTIEILHNEMGTAVVKPLCQSVTSDTLHCGVSGNNYQWQISTDSVNYTNLVNGTDYFGVNGASMILNNIDSSWYGTYFRCIVDGKYAPATKIVFRNTWLGLVSNAWENPANWSCNKLPEGNSDVVINNTGNNPVLSSNGICRTFTLLPGSNFTITPGFTLTVTH